MRQLINLKNFNIHYFHPTTELTTTTTVMATATTKNHYHQWYIV